MTDPSIQSAGAATQAARAVPGLRRISAIELLLLLVALFLSSAFIEDLPAGDLIEAALTTGVMVFSVMAVGASRQSLITALLLVTPAIGGKWANHFWPGTAWSLFYLAAGMIFFTFVVARLIRFILRANRVDANVLCAGLAGYLLLGLLWVPAYVMVTHLNPRAFNMPTGSQMNGFNAFYFSFITLCTVGYGDLTPASNGARMLAVTEAIAGLFYVTVLISRLVALYSTAPVPAQPGSQPGNSVE